MGLRRREAVTLSGVVNLPRLHGNTPAEYKGEDGCSSAFGGSPTEVMTLRTCFYALMHAMSFLLFHSYFILNYSILSILLNLKDFNILVPARDLVPAVSTLERSEEYWNGSVSRNPSHYSYFFK